MAGSALGYRSGRVQRLRRLLGRRSARREERRFVVEGPHALSEAVAAGVAVEEVYLGSSAGRELRALAEATGAPVFDLSDSVVERVAHAVSPQPVLAIAPFVDAPLAALRQTSLLVVCAGVADPGNVGTVVRTAAAAGADGVVCCADTADLYNPKTVRASAGALFRVPVVTAGPAVEVLTTVGVWGLHRFGTVARGGVEYTEVDLAQPAAFVLGSEAGGLPHALAGQLDELLTIPMSGGAESLNVGVAAGVLCFEAARQRRRLGVR